jgi:cell division septation protein DedD
VQVRVELVTGSGQVPPPPAAEQDPSLDRDLDDLPLRDFSGNLIDEAATAQEAAQGNPSANNPALAEAEKYTPSFFQVLAFKKEVKGFGVQVGAYFSYYRLMNALDELNAKGYQQLFIHNTVIDGKPAFRVIAGQFMDREAAKSLQKKLAKDKVKGIVVSYQALKSQQ